MFTYVISPKNPKHWNEARGAIIVIVCRRRLGKVRAHGDAQTPASGSRLNKTHMKLPDYKEPVKWFRLTKTIYMKYKIIHYI